MRKSIKFSIRHRSIPVMVLLLTLMSLTGCGNSGAQSGPAAENLAKGKIFMEQNKLKNGIVILDSGIQYKVITKGNGKSPKLTDVVVVHSRGKHIDGTTFSDSYKENRPDKMLVKHMISGWMKTIPLMSVGGKWTIYLPPRMAFSSRGAEGFVEPNETLIYEIELVSIEW